MRTTLQIAAMVSMLLDHAAVIYFGGSPVLRCIGRAAFVLYAWSVMESVHRLKGRKTGAKLRYLLGLLVLALVSEIPYDMMHYDLISDWGTALTDQNVVFTFTVTAAVSLLCDADIPWLVKPLSWFGAAAVVALIDSEYGIIGVSLCMLYHICLRLEKGGHWPAVFYSLAMTGICVYVGIEPWRYLGGFAAAALLLAYAKKPDALPALDNPPAGYRTFRHWFYPGHMAVLLYDTIIGYIVILMGYIVYRIPFMQ